MKTPHHCEEASVKPPTVQERVTTSRTLKYSCLTLMGVMLAATPAIVRGQDFAGASATAAVISNVAVAQDAQRIAIRIEGAGHLDVHATRIQNPERLVLDFTGARLKVRTTSIPGVSAPVRGVRLGQFRPDVARVVIDLTASVPYQITHEGDALVVYLQTQPANTNVPAAVASTTNEKPQEQITAPATTPPPNNISTSHESSNAATAHSALSNEPPRPSATAAATNAPVQPATVQGQDFAVASATAAVISNVAIIQDALRVAIRVEGAGHLDVHATRIQNPERLALDFTGARLDLPALDYVAKELQAILDAHSFPRHVEEESIPGGSAPVRGVRLEQFRPDVARVVVDLTAPVPYQITHDGDAVVVYVQTQPADTNAPAAVASTTSEKSQKQITAPTTTPPPNNVSTSHESSNAATAHSGLSNELTQPSATPAVSTVPPDPEGGTLNNNAYYNPYFGLRYALAPHWTQKNPSPDPSQSGHYLLAEIRPPETSEQGLGGILITAQDLFFTSKPATNAAELIEDVSDNLNPDNKVELAPTEVQFANHSFVRFDYGSDEADLHWHIFATQIRCHALEFIFSGTKLAELMQGMNMIELPPAASSTGGRDEDNVPVCIKDYASGQNVIQKVDPTMTEHRFNAVPVRIIIDKEGKVKHIHFLTGYPDQTKAITDALTQWKFRPYLRNGHPVEVETGILFGLPPRPVTP